MTVVYWLTRDVRLDDNPALSKAAQGEALVCVFMVDPRWFEPSPFGWPSMGPHRWAFLWQSLMELESSLSAFGQRLIIRWQTPESGLPEIIKAVDGNRLVASRPTAIDEWRQWRVIEAALPCIQCDLVETLTLFNETDLPFKLGALPDTFSKFRRLIEKQPLQPAKSIGEPSSLPPAIKLPDLDQRHRCPARNFLDSAFAGGQLMVKNHLHRYIWDDQSILTYKETRNALDDESASSRFSPWLAAGSLSVRRLSTQIRQFEVEVARNESTYWLYFELLWREYFQWSSRQRGSQLFRPPAGAGQTPGLKTDSMAFKRWLRDSNTHALVRAGRVQLETTGYLSNRMRQIMASACIYDGHFDWRIGAEWFEHFLVDYDVASNYGNWQYIAGIGADPRGGRVFNIDKQCRQYDAEGEYRRRWLNVEH